MNNPYLLLWLEGPLQAWGHDSKFGRRDSLPFPTKSGVLGLLCCARGAGGLEVEWLARWAPLDMRIHAYTLKDRPRSPLLPDFQMVGSGYDSSDPWETLLIPKTRDGKKAVGGGTKLTYRYYLQDMAFAVALEAPASDAEATVVALQNPVWDLYLGRKACVPTELVFQGLYPSADEALSAATTLANAKDRTLALRVRQGEHDGDVLTLNDVPVQFGTQKRYRDRRVTIESTE